ncbi:uncharacterized protein LOC111635896 [Centruroides sculpturatus]|uniref:uncharacterized protein LOC111635895 n=1 Tax=Centruroides sculpturatus TaxID=218467 RepID=UPI000C6CA1A2|nr:uncharacterized protein LOC111635895 [Centruroides sculpturatus]XP_023236790.1 uncharacterized protein LOC111635896 [Centruroides sculpturatus]
MSVLLLFLACLMGMCYTNPISKEELMVDDDGDDSNEVIENSFGKLPDPDMTKTLLKYLMMMYRNSEMEKDNMGSTSVDTLIEEFKTALKGLQNSLGTKHVPDDDSKSVTSSAVTEVQTVTTTTTAAPTTTTAALITTSAPVHNSTVMAEITKTEKLPEKDNDQIHLVIGMLNSALSLVKAGISLLGKS